MFQPGPWLCLRRAAAFEAADPYTVANALMVLDLLAAIDEDRPPACNQRDGLWTIEMITGVYRSQITGDRVTFPLQDRSHPLEALVH